MKLKRGLEAVYMPSVQTTDRTYSRAAGPAWARPFSLNSGYIWNKTETKHFHWNKTLFCVCFVTVLFQL